MDPLSAAKIASTAATVAKGAWDVGQALYTFINDAKTIDSTMQAFANEIKALSAACEVIGTRLEAIVRERDAEIAARTASTGELKGSLWSCLEEQIAQCEQTVSQLKIAVGVAERDTTSNVTFLNQATRRVKLNMKAQEIVELRPRIQSHTMSLQLMLQVVAIEITYLAPQRADQRLCALIADLTRKRDDIAVAQAEVTAQTRPSNERVLQIADTVIDRAESLYTDSVSGGSILGVNKPPRTVTAVAWLDDVNAIDQMRRPLKPTPVENDHISQSTSRTSEVELTHPRVDRTLQKGPDPSRVRLWTDRSGSFKVEAEFIGLRKDRIHLYKLNGIKIAVPCARMALEDLEYVERAIGASLQDHKPSLDIEHHTADEVIGQGLDKNNENEDCGVAESIIGEPSLRQTQSILIWMKQTDTLAELASESPASTPYTETSSVFSGSQGPDRPSTVTSGSTDSTARRLNDQMYFKDSDQEDENSGSDDDFFMEAAANAMRIGREAFDGQEYAEASIALEEALKQIRELPINKQSVCDPCDLRFMLGVCTFHLQAPEAAESALLSVLESTPKVDVQTDVRRLQVCTAGHLLSQTYLRLGKIDQARQYCVSALQGRRRLLGKSHDLYFESLALLSRIEELDGKSQRSKVYSDMIPVNLRAQLLRWFEELADQHWREKPSSPITANSSIPIPMRNPPSLPKATGKVPEIPIRPSVHKAAGKVLEIPIRPSVPKAAGKVLENPIRSAPAIPKTEKETPEVPQRRAPIIPNAGKGVPSDSNPFRGATALRKERSTLLSQGSKDMSSNLQRGAAIPPAKPTENTISNIRLSFITAQDQAKFEQLFNSATEGEKALSGAKARDLLLRSKLDALTLARIWTLSDTRICGQLMFPEFAVAMYLCNLRLIGQDLPLQLPEKIKSEVSAMIDTISDSSPT